MGVDPGQDRKTLREQQYADDAHLDVRRRTHQLYTVNPVNFGRWTLERLSWRGDERVLDVGCGPGDLLRNMGRLEGTGQHRGHGRGWGALVGFDFSDGMIAEATRATTGLSIHFFVGEAQAISLPDGTFDVVMARHMLYHVPDIDRAAAEMARVLRPRGRLLVTTNSAHTMPQYRDLCKRAAARFPAMVVSERITDRFALENAKSFLDPYFDELEIHTLPGTLRFHTAQPFIDYFASARTMRMHPDHTEAEWQAILEFAQAEVEGVIAREGRFDVTKVTGALVGVKRG